MKYVNTAIVLSSFVGLMLFSLEGRAKETTVPMPVDPVLSPGSVIVSSDYLRVLNTVEYNVTYNAPTLVKMFISLHNQWGKRVTLTPQRNGMIIPGLSLPLTAKDVYVASNYRIGAPPARLIAHGIARGDGDANPFRVRWGVGVMTNRNLSKGPEIIYSPTGANIPGPVTVTLPAGGGDEPVIWAEVSGDYPDFRFFVPNNFTMQGMDDTTKANLYWQTATMRYSVENGPSGEAYLNRAVTLPVRYFPKTTGMVMPEMVDCGTGYVDIPLECGAVSGWVKDGGVSWLVSDITYTRTDTNNTAHLWIDNVKVLPGESKTLPWVNGSSQPAWQQLKLNSIRLQSDVTGDNSAQLSFNVRYR